MTEEKDYIALAKEVGEENLAQYFEELEKTANTFIEAAGFQDIVFCSKRILMQAVLDYYSDIKRLKEFHEISKVRTEKIFAYTIAWIIRRKPLQYRLDSAEEKDIFVNERFAVYLLLNECMDCGEINVEPRHKNELDDYIDLLLYYFKYRECNPKVIELAISSFKMGTLVIK